MTTPLSDHRGELGHRRASRLSRRFAMVGVDVTPDRLRELAAGAPAAEYERIDVIFAMAVCDLEREHQPGRATRVRRRCARWLLVSAVGVALLSGLILLAVLIFSMAAHIPPLYG